jgi:hypothetical protein
MTTKCLRSLLAVVPLFAFAGCVADPGEETVTVTEPATGGTSGDPAIPLPINACLLVSVDKVHVRVGTNPDGTPQMEYADGLLCYCDRTGVWNGHLRRDDPNAPSTYFCRAVVPAGCAVISRDRENIKVGTDADGAPIFMPGLTYPCSCPARGISSGLLIIDDPNAPNTFYCRQF